MKWTVSSPIRYQYVSNSCSQSLLKFKCLHLFLSLQSTELFIPQSQLKLLWQGRLWHLSLKSGGLASVPVFLDDVTSPVQSFSLMLSSWSPSWPPSLLPPPPRPVRGPKGSIFGPRCTSCCLCMILSKFKVFCFCFCFLGLFAFSRAASAAYGGSQARGLIGATAAGLHHSHSNMGSEPGQQPTPQLTATPDL